VAFPVVAVVLDISVWKRIKTKKSDKTKKLTKQTKPQTKINKKLGQKHGNPRQNKSKNVLFCCLFLTHVHNVEAH
jgi:hypothetical protein